uniref:RRM domain-containing protein n=1 Tax=Macrostomum lignano TaxID=282301 RepID=A0A1I8FRS6_9PLAT
GIDRVIFTGNFLRCNELSVRPAGTRYGLLSSRGSIKALFVQHEGYLGALGSLMELVDPDSINNAYSIIMDCVPIIANQSAGELAHEVQPESDGSLSLVSLAAEFPGALGLQYRCPPDWQSTRCAASRRVAASAKRTRALVGRRVLLHFFLRAASPPTAAGNDSNHCPETGERNGNSKDCEDLIVLGLPYDCQEQDLRAYFDSVSGVKDSLAMAQIKRDWTGTSRGFGFVRFSDMASQESALATRFYQPRTRMVLSSSSSSSQQMLSRRVFIGGITDKLSEQTLTEYFTKELGLEVSASVVSCLAGQIAHSHSSRSPAPKWLCSTDWSRTTVSNYGANICPYYALEQPQPGTVLMQQQQYQPVRFAQH